MIIRWIIQPADWWQFWYPQSGFQGGCIVGMIISFVLFVIFVL